MRTPRLTCVSDGNPFRLLLINSKKWQIFEVLSGHSGTPSLKMCNVTVGDTTNTQKFGPFFRKLQVATDHAQQRQRDTENTVRLQQK